MKKIKVSLVEKTKIFRMVTIFALVQLIIGIIFVNMLIGSQKINENDTKQIDITVDDMYKFRVPMAKTYWLVIVSDSSQYLFHSRSTLKEYSVSELNEAISIGSKLSLMYKEEDGIFGKTNLVVDARDETEIYRTIEEYNRGRQGVSFFVIVIFSIIEVIFVGIIAIYVWINYNVFKGFYKKIKKHQ
ncbi:MAG: hypothetical protein IJY69_06725 [Clostridia bacterium]|nr:hypothetical protein [Clostridia bacterium]